MWSAASARKLLMVNGVSVAITRAAIAIYPLYLHLVEVPDIPSNVRKLAHRL